MTFMAGEDPGYLDFVRGRRCCAPDAPFGCSGGVQAHHAGDRALSRRAHDRTAIPLCMLHHRQWHDASGPFETWHRDQRREWATTQIEATQVSWHEMPAWF